MYRRLYERPKLDILQLNFTRVSSLQKQIKETPTVTDKTGQRTADSGINPEKLQ
jgi:hypothetical protein